MRLTSVHAVQVASCSSSINSVPAMSAGCVIKTPPAETALLQTAKAKLFAEKFQHHITFQVEQHASKPWRERGEFPSDW